MVMMVILDAIDSQLYTKPGFSEEVTMPPLNAFMDDVRVMLAVYSYDCMSLSAAAVLASSR